MSEKKAGCEFCGDINAEMWLHPKCHITAPLQASVIDGWIILRCYLPECLKEVARFKIQNHGKHNSQADQSLTNEKD